MPKTLVTTSPGDLAHVDNRVDDLFGQPEKHGKLANEAFYYFFHSVLVVGVVCTIITGKDGLFGSLDNR